MTGGLVIKPNPQASIDSEQGESTTLPVMAAVLPAESSERFLSSHPATAERVGMLLRLAY